MKVKVRYIAAALTVVASIAVTPASIEAAYAMRGYEAYGGEYLVIPLGLIAALIILETAKARDCFKQRQSEDSGEPAGCEAESDGIN